MEKELEKDSDNKMEISSKHNDTHNFLSDKKCKLSLQRLRWENQLLYSFKTKAFHWMVSLRCWQNSVVWAVFGTHSFSVFGTKLVSHVFIVNMSKQAQRPWLCLHRTNLESFISIIFEVVNENQKPKMRENENSVSRG